MSEKNNYLTFVLGKELFAIDINHVQEIRVWEEPTPMPNLPKHVVGVLDLRGEVVPIADLRLRFNLPAPYEVTTVVMVVTVNLPEGEKTIGMVADAVSDVYELDTTSLQPAPDVGAMDSSYVRGLVTMDVTNSTTGKDMVIVIDVEKMAEYGLMGGANALSAPSFDRVLSRDDLLKEDS